LWFYILSAKPFLVLGYIQGDFGGEFQLELTVAMMYKHNMYSFKLYNVKVHQWGFIKFYNIQYAFSSKEPILTADLIHWTLLFHDVSKDSCKWLLGDNIGEALNPNYVLTTV